MRSVIFPCALFTICFFIGPQLQAQLQVSTIHIRVLRGSNAKPVRRATVSTTVIPIEPYATPILRSTDPSGEVSLLVQGDAGVRATVLHYPSCRHIPKAERKQPPRTYPVEQILTSGVVSENGCGRHTEAPTPGELILLVRPLHWWKRLSY